MARGKRTKVAKGIYSDQYGFSAVVVVGDQRKEHRFAGDTPIEKIEAWQKETRGTLLIESAKGHAPQKRNRDSFRRAVASYLKQIKGRRGAASDRSHLMAWIERLGDRSRSSITAADVRLALAAWRTEGQRRLHQKRARPLQPQTLRHRYRVLKKLYHVLDGPTARTPCDDVPRPGVPKTIPKDVKIDIIRKVATRLREKDPMTYARFIVLATTGKAPAELMRASENDVDFRRRTWRIFPSKGRDPQLLELNDEMIAALKVFRAANAWGEYDTTKHARILRRYGWPEDVRPYNVRHALAIELLRRGADIGDIQAHLGHASVETTRTFYAGYLREREKRTSKRLEGRLGLKPAS